MSTLQGPHALHPRLAAAVRAAALLLLVCLSHPASAQSCGLVYGNDWAFLASIPDGWNSACGNDGLPGTNLSTWPASQSPDDAEAVIYVSVNSPNGRTLAQFQAEDLAKFRQAAQGVVISDLTATSGQPAPRYQLVRISNAPGHQEEYVAYLEAFGSYYILVLTANSPALAMAYEPAFREFIDDFQPMALERDGVPANAMRQRARDEAAIRGVVEAFRTAIIRKDKAAFMALFYSDGPARVTWQFVVDDARLARVQKAKPEARKARYIAASNHVNFIDGIVAEPAAEEEVFKDVVVDTDGEVASVAFDYAYLSAGKETNHGREMWQLVRTEAGWKIIAVIFSVRDPVDLP